MGGYDQGSGSRRSWLIRRDFFQALLLQQANNGYYMHLVCSFFALEALRLSLRPFLYFLLYPLPAPTPPAGRLGNEGLDFRRSFLQRGPHPKRDRKLEKKRRFRLPERKRRWRRDGLLRMNRSYDSFLRAPQLPPDLVQALDTRTSKTAPRAGSSSPCSHGLCVCSFIGIWDKKELHKCRRRFG